MLFRTNCSRQRSQTPVMWIEESSPDYRSHRSETPIMWVDSPDDGGSSSPLCEHRRHRSASPVLRVDTFTPWDQPEGCRGRERHRSMTPVMWVSGDSNASSPYSSLERAHWRAQRHSNSTPLNWDTNANRLPHSCCRSTPPVTCILSTDIGQVHRSETPVMWVGK